MARDFRRRRFLRSCARLTVVWTLPAFAAEEAGDPAAGVIRAFYDALLTTMKQASQLGVRGRYARLDPVIRTTFDLGAMTRIAVGPEWNTIPPTQQKDLVDGFSRMTIATYANRFDGYSGERFEVDPAPEQRSTGRVVRTRIVQSSGEPVRLDYLMRGSGNAWKVVDVYLTGTISELATRRSEFASILKSGGPAALIETLRHQTEQLLRAPAPSS